MSSFGKTLVQDRSHRAKFGNFKPIILEFGVRLHS